MANSKYEYVKSFEVQDEVFLPNIIVVRIDGRDFRRFSEVHEFQRANDEEALKLMNACAESVLEQYPDIVFAYGYSDEYSFVFKKTTKFYQRRASKILSLVVSFFTSVYVTKWKEFFRQKELRYPPSFNGRVIHCATIEVLQEYLAWRQHNCHATNQYNTCFWKLVECGMCESEAREILKGTQKQEKNELLFQQFNTNYKDLPCIFRQGSCVLKTEEEDVVKHSENGTPVKRLRRKTKTVHSANIAGARFWNEQSILLRELGSFAENVSKVRPDYIKSFVFENKLMPSTWIVVRIDGCHFHRFSEVHEFEKPNDKQALKLMNSCAVAVLQEFQDVNFAYGISDEYSFVLKKGSQLYGRQAREALTGSFLVYYTFTCGAVDLPVEGSQKELKYPPTFDGRAVCYPSSEILRDYLAWRQVDCHINNQYNTCFWELVKCGKSKSEAQNTLKGTQAREKNELLTQFGIIYDNLEKMFRLGSSIFREDAVVFENGHNGASVEKLQNKVVEEYCDIIEQSFWKAHPSILN